MSNNDEEETTNNTTTETVEAKPMSEAKQDKTNFETTDPLLNKKRFENRRKMAWWSMYMILASLIFVLIFTSSSLAGFMFFPELMANLDKYKIFLDWASGILEWVITANIAIIMTYMGSTSWAIGKFAQSKKIESETE